MKLRFRVMSLERAVGAATLAAAGLALLLPAGPALAIQGIGTSPTSQELTLTPGKPYSGTLTVINDGDNDITYKVYATDYRVKGETYVGDFDAAGGGPKVSAVSWFKLPAGNMVVKARQEINLPYTITAPVGATAGGHYAAIFVQTIPPASSGAAIINRVDRVASLFYLAVGGPLHPDGEVLPLVVPLLQSASPVTGTLQVKSTGNVHFQTELTAQLSSPFGKVGKPLTARGEVLPATTRRFDVQLPASSPIGLYNMSVTVKYLGHSVTQSHWMLLMPRLTFLIVSATLILVLLLVFWRLMRRVRRISRDRG